MQTHTDVVASGCAELADERGKTSTGAKRSKKPVKPSLAKLALVAERLGAATPARFGCSECGLFKKCAKGSAFASVWLPKGWTKKLLVVTEYPESPETEGGKAIRRWARKAGYTGLDVAFVGALRCTPKKKKRASMKQIRGCRPFLLRVVSALTPHTIVCSGAEAIRALTNSGQKPNIIEQRGRLLKTPGLEGIAAYGTFGPETAPDLWPRVIEDFQRASWPALAAPINEVPHGKKTVSVDSEFTVSGECTDLAISSSEAAFTASPRDPVSYQRVADCIQVAERLVGHSVMSDVDSLVRLGLAKPEWVDGSKTLDSLLLARMSDENRGKGGYGVETLLLSGHKADAWKYKTEEYSETDSSLWPADLRAERCRLDAWASAVVTRDFYESARGPIQFMHRVGATLHRIRHAGAYVDLDVFEEVGSRLEGEVARSRDLLLKSAQALGMPDFSPTNDGHIRELLFERMKLPAGNKTKSGKLAIDKVTLKQFADNEIVKTLQEFNKADKRYSVNVAGFRELLTIVPAPFDPTISVGYLPVSINPFGARTGRRSSSKPNFQNWPKEIRRIIRSRWKGGLIGDHDYSRLEVVLMAWLCGDAKLFDYFANGDGYIGVGRELWNKEVEKDTEHYRVTKSVVLGVQYGMGAFKLANQLWFNVGVKLNSDFERHVELCGEVRQRYLDRFPGIKRYMRLRRQELINTGMVVAKSGVCRRLPCPDGENTPGFGHLLNESINFGVQHFASCVTGSALIDIERALLAEHKIDYVEYHKALLEKRWLPMATIINEVHDDVVLDYFPDTFKRDQEIVIECMRSIPTLRKLVPDFTIPLKVGVSAAPRWCE